MRKYTIYLIILLVNGISGFSYATITNTPMNTLKSYHWTVMGNDTTMYFRLITHNDTCPAITIDGNTQPMVIRHNPDHNFPILVCEKISTTTNVKDVHAGHIIWPTLKKQKAPIAIMGDTGCRENSISQQKCDKKHWPLHHITEGILLQHPKLVIHVGDYLYRERCIVFHSCKPVGYNYASWEADVFHPMKKILANVPFIFARGNHENCKRAYRGWYIFFYAGHIPEYCENIDPPSIVYVDDYAFMNFDSSANHNETNVLLNNGHKLQLIQKINQILPNITKQSKVILVTHKPLAGYITHNLYTNATTSTVYDKLLNARKQSYTVLGILSGHIHSLEFIQIFHGFQAIFGASGTSLDVIPHYKRHTPGVFEKFGDNEFGFGLLQNDTLSYINNHDQELYHSTVLY